jgi:YD repeat-containing protein
MNRGFRVTLVVLAICAAVDWRSDAMAQTATAAAENGFQPNRDYLSLQPWESIDTASGNLVLTFADLVLPGNAGRELRFERVYNNTVTEPTAQMWRFSVSGLPLRVTHRTIPPSSTIGDSIVGNRLWTPVFAMPDGSFQQTVFEQLPTLSIDSTDWVITPQFWRYRLSTRTLYLPDGTVARYSGSASEEGRLIEIRDQYANVTTLGWTETSLTVTQSLGAESRTVGFVLNAATGLPETMTYGESTWTYEYYPGGKLHRVTSPLAEAAPWLYEYEGADGQGKMRAVTTPQGGRASYTYEWQWFYFGPEPHQREEARVLRTRAADGPGVETGTWEFSYVGFTGPAGMTVRLPSGYHVAFEYASISGFSPIMLAGDFVLAHRIVYATDGSTRIEQEDREYEGLQAARNDRPWAVSALSSSTVTRAGRTYRTELTYDPDDTGDFSNYHRPRFKTERVNGVVARSSEFQYRHLTLATGPVYVVGLPLFETINASGQPTTRGWDYEPTTGFRRAESVNGITTTFTHDDHGNVATSRKANNKATAFTYSYGQVKDTTTPHVTTTRVINADGTVERETVAGRTTTFVYDELSRLRFRRPPGAVQIETEYDPAGQWQRVRRGNSWEQTTFDGFGRPVQTENGSGVRTRARYTAEGRLAYQSQPFEGPYGGPTDVGTTYTYDALGRITFEENADGTFRSRAYGADTITAHDERLRETVLTYQAFGHPDDTRLTGVRDAAGSQWTYAYNTAGSLTRADGPGGVSRIWEYDDRNLLIRETHPESGQILSNQPGDYDPAGVLKRKVDAKGTVFVYVHDDNDRLICIITDGQTIAIAYEPGSDNRLATSVMGAAPSSSAFEYDPITGRLTARTDAIDGATFRTEYAYDGNDNVTEIRYPSGRRVGYEYDAANRVSRVFNGHNPTVSHGSGFDYHPSGALEAYTAGNGVVTTMIYDPRRAWVTSISAGNLQLAYRYDEVGNVTAIDDLVRPAHNQAFTYDVLDRLETFVSGGALGPQTYAYDAHGNRASTPSMTYAYFAGRPFHLQSMNGGLAMDYDENGNLTSGPGVTMTYTPNNLLHASTAGSGTVRFAYDADDWRLKKQVTTGVTTYFVRGPNGQLLTEWANNNPTTAPNADVKDLVYVGSRLIASFKVELPPR